MIDANSLFQQILTGVLTAAIIATLGGVIRIVMLVRQTADHSKNTAKQLKRHMKREEKSGNTQDERLGKLELGQANLAITVARVEQELNEKLDTVLSLMPKRADD